MTLKLQMFSAVVWKVEVHKEREPNYQGHSVGGLLVEMILNTELWVF